MVEDAVGWWIQEFDPRQSLHASDFQDVLDEVSRKVLKAMDREERTELDDEDRNFISRRVRKMVRGFLDQYEAERTKPTRFKRGERIVCRLGGERPWASGSVAGINVDRPEDPSGPKLPYVVKIDPPQPRLISVPHDINDLCRAEVCFGQRAGALWFTLFCMPSKPCAAKRRFDLGEAVVVAVEDESSEYSVWAAGKIVEVDYRVTEDARALMPEADWAAWAADSSTPGLVPYKVKLDSSGGHVLVHRDEHWLVRDPALQRPGVRQSAATFKGTAATSLTRLERRHKGDYTWEAIDHMTRRVRPCEAPSDGEHSDGCDCDCCG